MSQVNIYNQIGRMRICPGTMCIDRQPSGVDYNSILDWSTFCDDVDEVLKAGTAPMRLEYVGNIFLFVAFISLGFIIASTTWLKGFDWGIFIAIVLLNLFLSSYVMRRINQVMNDLNTLVESRGRNGIKYEVQSQGTTVFAKHYHILVHGVIAGEDDEAPQINTSTTNATWSDNPEITSSTFVADAAAVSPSPTANNIQGTRIANVNTELQLTTGYSPSPGTGNSTTSMTGGTTSIFDQLKSNT